jgi:PII-like signaling protein
VAGFGRHGRHDAGFFELAGELPVVVEFFVEEAMADRLLKAVAGAGLKLVYAKLPAEIGVTA